MTSLSSKYTDRLDRSNADEGSCRWKVVTVSWTAVLLDDLTSLSLQRFLILTILDTELEHNLIFSFLTSALLLPLLLRFKALTAKHFGDPGFKVDLTT